MRADDIDFTKCARCGCEEDERDGWALHVAHGKSDGIVCPDCLTPEQQTEVTIRESTADWLITQDERGELAVLTQDRVELDPDQ